MTVSTTTLQATFVSESAAYENTFGWYNKVTGYGGILFADTEAEGRNAPLVPGVSSVNFTVNTADLGNIQFFLISDGYNRNSGDDFTGAIKVIQLSDGSWAVANVDSQGRVITRHGKPDILVGEGANALFTETSKNAGGVDYASSVTGTNQTAAKLAGDTADGATGLIAWEDIAATRKSNGSYTKPGDADYNDAVFRITTVNGNRPPVGNADSVSVGEDAGPTTINVLGNDTDPDAGNTLRVTAVNTAGLVGTVTIGAGGANIVYTPAASFQSLGAGQTATETFSYTVSDAAGATSTASVTVTIVGANDVAVIGSPINASVTEDLGANGAGNLTATGTISVTDVDTGQAGFRTAVTGAGGNLGSLVIAANGAYTYTVANAATQSLAVGETRTDTFTITSIDGTQKTVDFTVNGVNDAPVIQLPPGAPPTIATVQEDAAAVSGQLTATDPDHGAQLTWSVVGGTTSHHADYSFAIDQFRIVRFNDNANPLFVDDFDAGDPPPDSPPFNPNGTQNPHTYGGLTGTFTETGGRAIMDSDLSGAGLGVGTPDAFVANSALVRTDIATFNANPSATPGLKSNVPFVVEGTFDLALPDDRREAYGIRLTDRLTGGSGTPPDQQGDDGLDLVVRMGVDGIVRVQLVEVDFLNDEYNILGGTPFNAAGYEQIKLRLAHSDPVNNSGRITASFDLIDSDGILPTTTTTLNVVGRIFGTETPAFTGDDENWTRAQIVAYAPEESGSSLNGQYGTLTVRQDGSYFYNPGNNLAVVQALAQGETVYDDFQVRVTDEHGATDIETVRIAVQGRNDAPVVSAAVSGGGNEDTSFVVDLLQNASDVDHSAILHVANVVWDEVPGNLPLGFALAGNSITVDASGGAYQGLALGETVTTHFSYSVVDELGASAIQHATVVITGTNDAATIGGSATGTVVEAGGHANGTPGTPTASGNLTVQDLDNGQAAFQMPASLAGIYGTFSFDASSGAWSYALDNGAANVQALTSTSVVHDTLTVTSLDGTATQVIDVTVQGANDAPTVTGNASGTVTEDQPSALQSRGNLFSNDPDGGPASWSIVGGTTTPQTQDFRFQVDNLKIIRNGFTFFEDTFGDGNPPPSSPTFGYTVTGAFTEAAGRAFFDGTQAVAIATASGVRAVLNTDLGPASNGAGLKRNTDFTVESRFDLITPQDGGDTYGVRLTDQNSAPPNNDSGADLVVTRDATGVHVALREVNNFTGVITVLESVALTPPPQSQIVLRLAYDDASYIDAANGGSVTASFDIVTNGVVVSTTSLSSSAAIFKGEDFTRVMLLGQSGQPEAGVYKLAGTYGTLTVAQDGQWHYFLADHQANVQALAAGQTVTDTFTVRADDGQGGITDRQVVVTINGAAEPVVLVAVNDTATMGENDVATVNVLANDTGTGLTLQSLGFATVMGPLGIPLFPPSLSIVGNQLQIVPGTAFDALGAGQFATLTVPYTVRDANGATATATAIITVNGVNDVAFIGSPASTTVFEDLGIDPSGQLFVSGFIPITDLDFGQGQFQTIVASAPGNLGSLQLTATGTYTYSVLNAVVQYLGQNQSKTDTFTISSIDGTQQAVSFTINGANDSAVIVPPFIREVREDVQVDMNGRLVATGSIFITDPDLGQSAFQTTVGNMPGNRGILQLVADGSYEYSVSNALVQDLRLNQTATDSFIVSSVDGTQQVVTFTIHGTNDIPTIGAPSVAFVTEDLLVDQSGMLTAAGFIPIFDVDSGESGFQTAVSGAGDNLGTLQLGVNGSYTYAVDNAAVQFLDAGQAKVDTFVVTSIDGTQQTLSFTINGASDVATIEGLSTGLVIEDGTTFTSGTLTVLDTPGEDHFQTPASLQGAYGAFGFDPMTGEWSYTLANSAGVVQSLGANQFVHDQLVVVSADGSANATIDVTILGTNDTPTYLGGEDSGAVGLSLGQTQASGQFSFDDIDISDGHSVLINGLAGGYLGILTASVVDPATGAGGGTVQWTFNISEGQLQALSVGEERLQTYDLVLADNQGGLAHQTVTISVSGQADPSMTDIRALLVQGENGAPGVDGAHGTLFDPNGHDGTPGGSGASAMASLGGNITGAGGHDTLWLTSTALGGNGGRGGAGGSAWSEGYAGGDGASAGSGGSATASVTQSDILGNGGNDSLRAFSNALGGVGNVGGYGGYGTNPTGNGANSGSGSSGQAVTANNFLSGGSGNDSLEVEASAGGGQGSPGGHRGQPGSFWDPSMPGSDGIAGSSGSATAIVADNILEGGSGNDWFRLNAGVGVYGSDFYFGAAGSTGDATAIVDGNVALGGDGNDQFEVRAHGTSRIGFGFDGWGTGGNVSVAITDNTFIGGAGDDMFFIAFGAVLNSTTVSGPGVTPPNPTFLFDVSGNIFEGGEGTDWLVLGMLPGDGAVVDLSTERLDVGFGMNTIRSIENITGTNHDDTIIGNAADNMLQGGDGNDTLTGGGGSDTFFFGPGDSNHDVITDFDLTGPDHDKLVIYDDGHVLSYQEVMARVSGDMIVLEEFGTISTLTLLGVSASQLTQDHF